MLRLLLCLMRRVQWCIVCQFSCTFVLEWFLVMNCMSFAQIRVQNACRSVLPGFVFKFLFTAPCNQSHCATYLNETRSFIRRSSFWILARFESGLRHFLIWLCLFLHLIHIIPCLAFIHFFIFSPWSKIHISSNFNPNLMQFFVPFSLWCAGFFGYF